MSSAKQKRHIRPRFLIAQLALLCLVLAALVPYALSQSAYVLGIGDRISFTLFAGGKNQLQSDKPVVITVSEDGSATFPLLGKVMAQNRTLKDLNDEVTKRLVADYFVNPQVIMSVAEYRSKKVYILGAVKKPGSHCMEEACTTLLKLISMAEGATEECGKKAFVFRGAYEEISKGDNIDQVMAAKKAIVVDIKRLLDEGDITADVELRADDVVYIPKQVNMNIGHYKVYVLGKVLKPGAYDFQEGITVLNACIIAGGFDKYAAPNRTTITRITNGRQRIIKIDLDDVNRGKKEDILLEPGDRIFVPRSWL